MTRLKILLRLAPLLAILAVAPAANAGPHSGVTGKMLEMSSVMVFGKLLSHEGQPVTGRTIHFENIVTGDTYLTRTGSDGAFTAALPPATYNMREEAGPIVMRGVQALTNPIELGSVREPDSWWDFLESEKVAPAQIHSPAPVTSSVRSGGPIQPSLRTVPVHPAD